MARVGSQHSILFPQATDARQLAEHKADTQAARKPPERTRLAEPVDRHNIRKIICRYQADAQLVYDLSRAVVPSDNAHGDLLIARSAALRLIESLDILIGAEEES